MVNKGAFFFLLQKLTKEFKRSNGYNNSSADVYPLTMRADE